MRGAEEVPTGAHLADGVQPQRVISDFYGNQELRHHLHHLRVDDKFLEGGT